MNFKQNKRCKVSSLIIKTKVIGFVLHNSSSELSFGRFRLIVLEERMDDFIIQQTYYTVSYKTAECSCE